MVTTLHQASREGNLMSVREHLDNLSSASASPVVADAASAEETQGDAAVEQKETKKQSSSNSAIDAKDENGESPLSLAVKAGHCEVVEELLARGADRSEVLSSDVAKSNPEMLALLEAAPAGAAPVPVDVHGGHQLPDGTVSYMHAGYGAAPFVPGYPAAPQGYYYEAGQMPPPPPQHFGNGGLGPRRNGGGEHARKESVVNLPPPEVARMIPCRNFPNCRYGDKCAFAHPMPMGAAGGVPHPGSAASGSMSPPPQHAQQGGQPMYYQPLPGYGYAPAPYAPGPQFYMAPPPHMQYSPNGVPLPIHFQPPQSIPGSHSHSPSHQHMHTVNGLAPGAEPFSPHFEQPQQPKQAEGVAAEAPQQDAQKSTSDAAAPAETATANATSSVTVDETEADTSAASSGAQQQQQPKANAPALDSQGRPIHRRQSFNSFLHHHAVPFQPGQMAAPVVDASGMPISHSAHNLSGMNGAVSQGAFRGGKARRGGGAFGGSGSTRREGSNASTRVPCTFFARGRCIYGSECRFPHIQQDGTDARSSAAQARQYNASAAATGAASAEDAAQAGSGASNGQPKQPKGRAGLPAPPQAAFGGAPPTGPQQQNKKQPNGAAAAQQPAKSKPAAAANGAQQSETSEATPAAPAEAPAAPAAASSVAPATASRTSSANKAAVNGNAALQASVSKANGANGQRSGPAGGANGNAKGANNTNAGNASRKLAAQREPTVNDFPALSSPNPAATAATTPSSPSLSALAGPSSSSAGMSSSQTLPPKANFSAILSAPAPVKLKAEPKAEATKADAAPAAEASEGKSAAPKANGHVQKAEVEVNGSASTESAKPAASSDDFQVVKPGKKSASTSSAAAAAVVAAAAQQQKQQQQDAPTSEGFTSAGPTAVAA